MHKAKRIGGGSCNTDSQKQVLCFAERYSLGLLRQLKPLEHLLGGPYISTSFSADCFSYVFLHQCQCAGLVYTERLGFANCLSLRRNLIHRKQDEADFDEGPREASDVSQV